MRIDFSSRNRSSAQLALIREAVRVQLWRPLGITSMREYLERRMGVSPQVAAERLRVAEALASMPITSFTGSTAAPTTWRT